MCGIAYRANGLQGFASTYIHLNSSSQAVLLNQKICLPDITIDKVHPIGEIWNLIKTLNKAKYNV